MPALRSLAVFGTASDVGKSVVTAGFCRALADAGVSVAPYKAQNMSNNAGVTPEGGEMGRAQIVQAEAARVVPHVDMNPVLLKPTTDRRSQVVLLGEVLGDREAADYFRDTTSLRGVAYGALDRLRARFDTLVLEGAGSCAEVNLRSRDFVNFDAAHAADADVVIVADIHRGGVFGQVVGTLACLDERDRARVKGILVNRFRGDVSLFTDGVAWLEAKTGLPVLGVLPWLRDLRVDPEDGLPPETRLDPPIVGRPRVRIGVLRLPHVANFTDFLPFSRVPGAEVHWLAHPRALDDYDLLVIPGTKNTRYDLEWLAGWAPSIRAYHAQGGLVLGVCGGYQMLGASVADPHGVEGPPGETAGLGLLDGRTTLRSPKITTRTRGEALGAVVEGYEIHMGRTETALPPLLRVSTRDGAPVDDASDGAVSADGRVLGTYLHGLLDAPPLLAALLARTGRGDFADVAALPSAAADKDAQYDRLADLLREHVDLPRLFDLLAR